MGATLAACGGAAQPTTRSVAGEWTANASGVIEQLRGDVVAAFDGDAIRSARAALRDESRLYGLLVAYSDLGGCRHMTRALGAAPPARRAAASTLLAACANLQRASRLFTRAASHDDAPALVAAARAARAAQPLLARAELDLRHPAGH